MDEEAQDLDASDPNEDIVLEYGSEEHAEAGRHAKAMWRRNLDPDHYAREREKHLRRKEAGG